MPTHTPCVYIESLNVDVATITITVTISLETKNAIPTCMKELGAKVGGGLIRHHGHIIRTLRYNLTFSS